MTSHAAIVSSFFFHCIIEQRGQVSAFDVVLFVKSWLHDHLLFPFSLLCPRRRGGVQIKRLEAVQEQKVGNFSDGYTVSYLHIFLTR